MYGTFAGAEGYFEARNITGFPSVQADGEALLLRASDALDSTYSWKGVLTDSAQSNAWPRKSVIDCEGRTVASDSVPAAIEYASYNLALLLETNKTALAATVQTGEFKKVKAGSVEVEYKDANTDQITLSGLAKNSAVLSLLRCYIEGYSGGAMIGLRKS